MRAFLLTLALSLTAACLAAESAAPPPQTPQQQVRDLLALVKKSRASVHMHMLAYIGSSRSLCFQIVLAQPESPQAKEACGLLGELYELARLMTDESDPMAGVKANAAGKMWNQAEHYADMDTAGSLRSAEVIYREIIRRYPETKQAVDAAMRLTQLSAALSVIPLWEQVERQASLNTREGLRSAEHLCKEIIRLYPESPQAREAAGKLLEVSAAIKKMPEPAQVEPESDIKKSSGAASTASQEPRSAFSFESDTDKEWLLPKPGDLYSEQDNKPE